MSFDREIGEIYRLKVPFQSVYTSVFLIKSEKGNALVDCATYDSDVDGVIVPALKEIGLSLTDIRYLILTHHHGDHAGGRARILELAPKLEVVQEVRTIALNGYTVCALKGHTLDSIGVFDKNTGTLISGDGLQGAGIKQYRCSLESKEEYFQTIDKIEQDENVQNILFSHAYEPWVQDGVFAREQVKKILEDCKIYAKQGE